MTNSRKLMGGRKKGNGHKINCGCPICKNMRKSKKGGGDDLSNSLEDSAIMDNKSMEIKGGKRKHKITSKKRGNGHKMNCGCPICKNMRKSKKRGGGEDGVIEDEDEDEIIEDEDENVDEDADEIIEDAVANEPIEDDDEIIEDADEIIEDADGIIEDEDQIGGKKHRKKHRKGKKTKKRSSRKGRKTKRRSSRRR